ncbi:MAG: META domain-containing protein [Xanthomonadales bacterium]|nr:META domain-containing protein [Xanthomonadales bacterium]
MPRQLLLLALPLLALGCENRREPTASAPAAKGPEAPAAMPVIESIRFRCGDLPLTAHFGRFEVTVELPDESFRLAEVASARGARYASGADPAEVEFWHEGEEALLTVRGTRYPPCAAERSAAPGMLRAEASDGSWRLEWREADGSLTLHRGAESVSGKARREPSEGGFELKGELGGRPFGLLVERNRHCVPTAGGWPRPHRARLRHGEIDQGGCAGTPEELLHGRPWQLVEVDFGFVPGSRLRPELVFTPQGRLFGQAYCNRFAGRWRLAAEGLVIEELAATKIACREPELNEAEQQLLDSLRAVRRIELDHRGMLLLTSPDGRRSLRLVGG